MLIYLNEKGTYKSHPIGSAGPALDMPPNVTKRIAQADTCHSDYQVGLLQSQATALCLADSLGLACGKPLAKRCSGTAAPAACGWTGGVKLLRDRARTSGSLADYYYATSISAYLLACHVGMHKDAHDESTEFIFERFSRRYAQLGPDARQQVQNARHRSHGRVTTPEFHMRWILRPCRDVGHMHWSQAAHMTPALSVAEQIVGDAGGGTVKYVGS